MNILNKHLLLFACVHAPYVQVSHAAITHTVHLEAMPCFMSGASSRNYILYIEHTIVISSYMQNMNILFIINILCSHHAIKDTIKRCIAHIFSCRFFFPRKVCVHLVGTRGVHQDRDPAGSN